MNNITHYFVAAFLVVFLSSCGTQITKENENKKIIENNEVNSVEPVKIDVVEEINKLDKSLTQRLDKLEKLDKSLTQRLDKLEKLIKSNHKPAKKRPIKKAAGSTTKKVAADKNKGSKSSQNNKIIIGEVEWVYLHTLNQSLKSRVDSGATTSSITASNIQPFERDGKNWVKFDIMHSATETNATIEARVVRTVRIRQASLDSYERRFVVSLDISLGDSLKQKAQFSLADRSEMTFPILLGREFLQDITLIDVGKKFLHPKYKAEAK